MIGRIATIGRPSVVFLSTCTLSRNQVWISSLQPGGHSGFVVHHHQMIFCGHFYHLPIVANAILRVLQLAVVHQRVHISRLYNLDTQAMVQRKGTIQLLFIVGSRPARFVMGDNSYAFRTCITLQRLQIVVGIGLGKRKLIAFFCPIAIPTIIPSLNQHTLHTMCSCEIDVSTSISRGGTMLRTLRPSHSIHVHSPPDAHILTRL